MSTSENAGVLETEELMNALKKAMLDVCDSYSMAEKENCVVEVDDLLKEVSACSSHVLFSHLICRSFFRRRLRFVDLVESAGVPKLVEVVRAPPVNLKNANAISACSNIGSSVNAGREVSVERRGLVRDFCAILKRMTTNVCGEA